MLTVINQTKGQMLKDTVYDVLRNFDVITHRNSNVFNHEDFLLDIPVFEDDEKLIMDKSIRVYTAAEIIDDINDLLDDPLVDDTLKRELERIKKYLEERPEGNARELTGGLIEVIEHNEDANPFISGKVGRIIGRIFGMGKTNYISGTYDSDNNRIILYTKAINNKDEYHYALFQCYCYALHYISAETCMDHISARMALPKWHLGNGNRKARIVKYSLAEALKLHSMECNGNGQEVKNIARIYKFTDVHDNPYAGAYIINRIMRHDRFFFSDVFNISLYNFELAYEYLLGQNKIRHSGYNRGPYGIYDRFSDGSYYYAYDEVNHNINNALYNTKFIIKPAYDPDVKPAKNVQSFKQLVKKYLDRNTKNNDQLGAHSHEDIYDDESSDKQSHFHWIKRSTYYLNLDRPRSADFVIGMCFILNLNYEESCELLASAGYQFRSDSPRDQMLKKMIQTQQGAYIHKVNDVLHKKWYDKLMSGQRGKGCMKED